MQSIELDYVALGNRIRMYRKQKEMTQQLLAEKTFLVPSNISHIERAKTKVSLPTLVRIANVLGVSVDQLLGDSLHQTVDIAEEDIAILLKDCTPREKGIIRDIIAATKETLRRDRNKNT
ncbi:helix-turn-helix transcriptional regulator [Ruminococcaceae bacterium OttesenSCG-928-A16]|nr:helix-turn-helix transcriptional regulator [Ruminococcaceae bacterium OttesenSCG-928-A16]